MTDVHAGGSAQSPRSARAPDWTLPQLRQRASAEFAHAHSTGSELYWMDGSHLAFALEAAGTAPAYVVSWLRDDS